MSPSLQLRGKKRVGRRYGAKLSRGGVTRGRPGALSPFKIK